MIFVMLLAAALSSGCWSPETRHPPTDGGAGSSHLTEASSADALCELECDMHLLSKQTSVWRLDAAEKQTQILNQAVGPVPASQMQTE
ncbi:hypothetical protein JOB18_005946 [Solea senegalensis]|uniref:Uncharacterized protein n=1 Tax=Solea senegalensis TaxID=28829 RepID=A0AAV6QKX3_SOLSE|nr:hypothetical protein JOB18_005946 [Solea senegalensis]